MAEFNRQLEQLADAAASIDLVADVVATAALGGLRSEIRRYQNSLVDATGPCTVVGRPDGTHPAAAAAANAAAVPSHQLQDGHRRARGHPASHIVPAVMAVAEAEGAPGAALLDALVAGYEAGVRAGLALGGTRSGVHDIGSWGPVGAAAGVAHLLTGGDEAAIWRAIAGAVSMPMISDAETVFQGLTYQHAYMAGAVQLAITAGRAAAAGLEPRAGALSEHFLAHVAAEPQAAALASGIDAGGGFARWEILDGYIKRHPTCAHLHGVCDAVEDLVAADVPEASCIKSIEVRTYAEAARYDAAHPKNALEARFSIPAAVAIAIVTGGLDETSFNDEILHGDDVKALAGRVRVVVDPSLQPGYPAGRPAIVEIRFRDGDVRRAGADLPRGDTSATISRDEIHAKARRLLGRRFGDNGAQRILAALLDLGSGPNDLNVVSRALREAAAGRPGPDLA